MKCDESHRCSRRHAIALMVLASAGSAYKYENTATRAEQEGQEARKQSLNLHQTTAQLVRQNKEIKTISIQGSDGISILELNDIKGFFINEENAAKVTAQNIKDAAFGEDATNTMALWMSYLRGKASYEWAAGAISGAAVSNTVQAVQQARIEKLKRINQGILNPKEVKVEANTLVIKLKKPANTFQLDPNMKNSFSGFLQSTLIHACQHFIGRNCNKIAANPTPDKFQ